MDLIRKAQEIIENSMPDDLISIGDVSVDYNHPDWDEVSMDLYTETEEEDYLYNTFGKDYDDCYGRICDAIVEELCNSEWYEELYQDQLSNKYS